MIHLDDLLTELSSRLPELEWKISGLSKAISIHHLPKGLFRLKTELTGSNCVAEIKADIHALSLQNNERSACFLAERIKQKINVMVALCQIDGRKKKPDNNNVGFGVSMLSTRQQWLQSLENEINTLTSQQQAMQNALSQMKKNGNAAVILPLQAELGEVERRLTLAQEAFNKAIL